MSSNEPRPYVLTIGGFDPCGGAGVLADVKAIEAHRAFAMAVVTANTIQTEDSFSSIKAENTDFTLRQISALLHRYPVAACKIGLTVSFDQLGKIVRCVNDYNPNIPIVWDPILRATAGNTEILPIDQFSPAALLPRLTLITPNIPEFQSLFPTTTPLRLFAQHGCAVLIKGGHAVPSSAFVEDRLFWAGGETAFSVPRSSGEKHGTGCVLSSVIAAQLAHTAPLDHAVRKAQQYVACLIASHPSRLGIHGREGAEK